MKFSIITPTTGDPHFRALLESVNALEIGAGDSVEHLVVVDGEAFRSRAEAVLAAVPAANAALARHVIQLPLNTGGGPSLYLGHKIYAGVAQLVDCDYVLFLDEDNFLDPAHIRSLSETLQAAGPEPLDWCFALRNIVDQSGAFVCQDRCESLGNLAPVFYNRSEHFIDTSCFCVSRRVAVMTSPVWNRPGRDGTNFSDRAYTAVLMANFKRYACTMKFTVNYRASHREGSATAEMFQRGNALAERMRNNL